MRNCMVLFCKNRGKVTGITYYKITKERYDLWMTALGRPPSQKICYDNVVCSDHFAPDDVITMGRRKTLKKGAVPKLKLKPEKPRLRCKENLAPKNLPIKKEPAEKKVASVKKIVEEPKSVPEKKTVPEKRVVPERKTVTEKRIIQKNIPEKKITPEKKEVLIKETQKELIDLIKIIHNYCLEITPREPKIPVKVQNYNNNTLNEMANSLQEEKQQNVMLQKQLKIAQKRIQQLEQQLNRLKRIRTINKNPKIKYKVTSKSNR